MMVDLLDMGRHSVFIWTSYGIVFGLLIILGVRSFTGQKSQTKKIAELKSARTATRDEDRA